MSKNRQARGEQSRSKLTLDQVRNIRQEYRKGIPGFSTVALSKKYKVTQCNIWHIVTGITWREA